jgi:hypothetical protein
LGVNAPDVIDPPLGELLRGFIVDAFNMVGGTGLVLGADVDREGARLPASGE